MNFVYQNIKKDKYFIHKKETKIGKVTYFVSKKEIGNIVNEIPNGYEIYEGPNGEVKLIKEQPKLILENEIQVLKKAIEKYSNIIYYKITVRGKYMTIYTSNHVVEEVNQEDKYDKEVDKHLFFIPIMRFIYEDDIEGERLFSLERYCFRGSIDDWIFIGGSSNLQELADEFCKHLGRMSFFELA